MKHKFKTTAQILVVVAAVAILATAAFAYTNPSGPAPSGNVPAPVNTGTFMQTKLGDLGLAGTGTGNLFATMNGWFGGGVFANQGYFQAGASTNQSALLAFQNGLGVLQAMGTTAGKGLTVSNSGSTTISGGLAITSGSPAAGYVLTSDASGNATWQPGSAQSLTGISTFGNGGLIEYVVNGGTTGGTEQQATCDVGYSLVGGGGHCDNNGGGTSDGLLTDSRPQTNNAAGTSVTGTAWYVHCGGTGNPAAHAFAICMKDTSLATVSSAPSPSQVAWHPVTDTGGTAGESCSSWLSSLHPTVQGYEVDDNTSFNGNDSAFHLGECAYQTPSQITISGVVTSCYADSATNPTISSSAKPVASCGDSNAYIQSSSTPISVAQYTAAKY